MRTRFGNSSLVTPSIFANLCPVNQLIWIADVDSRKVVCAFRASCQIPGQAINPVAGHGRDAGELASGDAGREEGSEDGSVFHVHNRLSGVTPSIFANLCPVNQLIWIADVDSRKVVCASRASCQIPGQAINPVAGHGRDAGELASGDAGREEGSEDGRVFHVHNRLSGLPSFVTHR